MVLKIQYNNDEEIETILNQHSDKILIEQQNLTSGNFLILSDSPRVEDSLAEIRNNTDLILLKQEGII